MGDHEEHQLLRVSDADREETVGILRDQTSAGRLTLEEFEERLGETYRARTAADLQHVLRELPVQPRTTAPPAPAEPTEEHLRRRYRRRLRGDLVGFAMPNFVCNLIWALGPMEYWWPGWVLLGTGLGLAGTLAKGFDPDAERARLVAEERKRAIAEIELRRALQRPLDGG